MKIINNNKNGDMKLGNFLRSTRTSSCTENSGATSLPPIGNSSMFIEPSSNNHGKKTYVTWEGTDIIQITNITFYCNRFPILSDDSLNRMGRFRIQLLIEYNTWSDQYTMAENSLYSNSSTEWTLSNLYFSVENFGIKLVYDRIQSAHANMCFSNITISHSVY